MSGEPELTPTTIWANGHRYDMQVGEPRDTNVPGIKAIPYYMHGEFVGNGFEGIPTEAGVFTLWAEPERNWLVRLAWPLDWTYCQIARPIEWLLRKLHVL